MSMTSHLKDSRTAIGKLFYNAFEPSLFLANIKEQLLTQKCIVYSPSDAVRARLIGTAIDYRLRFYFDCPPVTDLIAFHGAMSVPFIGGFFREGTLIFFADLISFLRTKNISKQRLPKNLESKLNYYCLTLAKLEVLYRARPYWLLKNMDKPAEEIYFRFFDAPSLGVNQGSSHILKFWERDVVNEMNDLSYLFYDRLEKVIKRRYKKGEMELNPTFNLSHKVGGADADLILKRTLIDFKSTKNNISKHDLFQVLGYTLLDDKREYRIDAVGIYFVRRGLLLQWKIREFYNNLQPKYTFKEFKNIFYKAVEKDSIGMMWRNSILEKIGT